MDCGHSGTWTYNQQKKRLRHNLTGKCLAVSTSQNQPKAVVKKCSQAEDEEQEWIVKQYNRRGLKYSKLLDDKPKKALN